MASKKALGTVLIEVLASTARMEAEFKKAQGKLKGFARDVQQIGDIVKTVFAFQAIKFGIEKINQLASSMKHLAEAGEQASSIREGFEALGGQSSNIQQASDKIKGLVSSFDLMATANKGLLAQIPGFQQSFSDIADLGGRLANVFGTDTKESIDQLTDAIIKGQAKALKPLGFTFTDVSNKALVTKEALSQLKGIISNLPEVSDSVANAMTAVGITIDDTRKKIAEQFNSNEELTEAFRNLQKAIAGVDTMQFGNDLAQIATFFVDLATDAIPPVVKGVHDFLLGLHAIVDFIPNLVQKVQDGFKGMARSIYESMPFADTLAKSGENMLSAASWVGGKLKQAFSPTNMIDTLMPTGTSMQAGALFNKLGEALHDTWAESSNKAIQETSATQVKSGTDAAAKVANAQKKLRSAGLVQGSTEAVEKTKEKIKELGKELSKSLADAKLDKLKENFSKALETGNEQAIPGILSEFETASQKMADTQTEKFKAAFPEQAEELKNIYYHKGIDPLMEQWATRQKEMFQESVDFFRSIYQNAITGTTFDFKDLLQQVAVGFAAQMSASVTKGIFGGSGIKSPQDLGGAIAEAIFGSGPGQTNPLGNIFGSIFGGGTSGIGPVASGAQYGASLSGIGPVASGEQYAEMLGKVSSFKNLFSTGPGGLFQGAGTSASYLAAIVGSLNSLSQIGKNAKGTGTAVGSVGGGLLGAAFGGPIGALAGGQIGGGVGGAIGKLLGGVFGSHKDDDTVAREEILKFIKEKTGQSIAGISGSSFAKGGTGFDSFNKLGADAKNLFSGLGEGLREVLGITQDVGPQIAAILAENLNGNLDKAKQLTRELGISQEDLEAAVIKAGLAMGKTWLEIQGQLMGIEKAFQPGLDAIGDLKGAFDEMVHSGGQGVQALQALRDIAIEGGEGGTKTLEALKSKLLQIFTPEQVNTFFKALQTYGIKSLDDLKNVSDKTAIAIIANMAALGFAFDKLGQSIAGTAQQAENLNDTVASTPAPAGTTTTTSGATAQRHALGGIVNSPTFFNAGGRLGLMGESGAEAIMPLTRIGGVLGVKAMVSQSGGNAGNSFYIDARGAAPGVENQIMQAMASIRDDAIKVAVASVRDMKMRGSYGNVFLE